MSYRDFFDALKAAPPRRVYLLHGDETYLRDRAAEALRARCLGDGLPELNHTIFEKADPAALHQAVQGLPFLAPYRLVEVREAAPLQVKGKGEEAGDDAPAAGGIEGVLQAVPESTVLLFLARGPLRLRPKVKRALQACEAVVFDFAPVSEGEAQPILRRFARAAQGSFAPGADLFLCHYCGCDLTALEHEVHKLCAAAPDGIITEEGIRTLCRQSTEWNVFQMLDDAVRGQTGSAMAALERMLAAGESTGGILSLVARQLRLMYLSKAGGDPQRLATRAGEHPYAMKRAAQQARDIPADRLQQALQACARCDLRIKQGLLEDDTAVALLLGQVMEGLHPTGVRTPVAPRAHAKR